MNRQLCTLLACPSCRQGLALEAAHSEGADVESGTLRCAGCGATFPIERGIPRFVPAENYSSSFGFQWNRFRRTQLDSFTGHPISRDRFFAQSGWQPSDLEGARVLDFGCGAGRFAEIALGAGARLVAVDYSSAVDACRANLGPHPRLDVVQGDVYRLPFKDHQFDFVYRFGVLQHTPDVKKSFMALSRQVGAGGRIAVDVYPELALNVLWPKYWLRPITRRVPSERLFRLVSRMVDSFWPVSLALGRVPRAGRRLRHALPIANYEGVLPLNREQLKDWAVLDTFDMLAPAHDHPQSIATLRQWFEEARLIDIDVFRRGLVVGRARQAPGAVRASAG